MSYTEEEQNLNPIIDKLLEDIKKFDGITTARIISNSWNTSHIEKIHKLRIDLLHIQVKLMDLK